MTPHKAFQMACWSSVSQTITVNVVDSRLLLGRGERFGLQVEIGLIHNTVVIWEQKLQMKAFKKMLSSSA